MNFFKLLNSVWLKLSFLIFSIIIIVFIKEHFKEKKPSPLDSIEKMSIYNRGSTGISAFRELLNATNIQTEVMTEQIPNLINPITLKHATTKLIEPGSALIITISILDEDTIQGIYRLAEYGINCMIFCTDETSILSLTSNDIKTIYKPKEGRDRVNIKQDPLSLFATSGYFVSTSPLRLSPISAKWQVLSADETGSFLIIDNSRLGSIIIHTLPDCMQNLNIGKFNSMHSVFIPVKHFANGKPVIFYEYPHGIKKKYTVFYLFFSKHYGVFFLSVLLLFVSFYLNSYLRFGVIKQNTESEEYIRYYSEAAAGMFSKKRFRYLLKEKILADSKIVLGVKKADEISNKDMNINEIRKKIIESIEGESL